MGAKVKLPRIAANTLISYLKSVVAMGFGLFTSRWVLAALGQADYGIYGLVGSVVSVFTFLQVVLSNSITRFYAVSPERELGQWMAVAIRLQVALAAAVVVVGLPLGEYAIAHWLVVPPERLAAGVWTFRVAIVVSALCITTVPWSALFSAKQCFGEPAAYDVAHTAAMFAAAGWLLTAQGDRLIIFTSLMAVVAAAHSLLVVFRAQKRFRVRASRADGFRAMQAQLLRYAACRILGIAGWLAQKQGNAIVVNLAFGVRANAAYAIANQFAIHAASLVSALASALTPALAQATGQEDRRMVNRMALRSCVCSGALAMFLGVPLLLVTEDVLRFWLVNPPEGAALLAFAFTAAMVADAGTTGLVAALSAVRNIGAWQAFECAVLTATCPVSWLLFHWGLGLPGLGATAFAAACVMTCGRLFFARRMIALAVRDWLVVVFMPLAVVCCVAFGVGWVVREQMAPGVIRMICVGMATTLVIGLWAMHRRRCWSEGPAACRRRTGVSPAGMAPCAPLAIFAFRRYDTLARVLDSLARCEELTGGGKRAGYAYLDGPRDAGDEEGVRRVRELMMGFKRSHFPNLEIVARGKNWGNTVNMPAGIAEVLDRHGRIIVVEDDVVVSRHFLTFMDEALELYEPNRAIWCVQGWRNGLVRVPRGYPHDVYLTPRCMCWGWGTWRERWRAVDFEMKGWPAFREKAENLERLDEVGVELKPMLDEQYAGTLHAWDVQCVLHMMERNLWAVEPRLAMTKNIGFGTACDHCLQGDVLMDTARYYDFKPVPVEKLTPVRAIYGQYRHAKRYSRPGTRIWRKILRIWAQI